MLWARTSPQGNVATAGCHRPDGPSLGVAREGETGATSFRELRWSLRLSGSAAEAQTALP